MANVLADTYTDTREQIVATWDHVKLFAGDGTLSLDLPVSDARVSWGDPLNNPVALTVKLSGGDADTVGKNFSSSQIFEGTEARTAKESITNADGSVGFTVQADEEHTFDHDVEVPEVV